METARQSRDPAVSKQEKPENDWEAKVERLQECVSLLLLKNQTLRMALVAAKAGCHSDLYW